MQKHHLSPDYGKVNVEVLKKKAEYGSMVHKEIEEWVKNQEVGFTNELGWFMDYVKAHNTNILACEEVVNDDIVAGTMDLLIEENGVVYPSDHKTTSTLHKDAISWQLSIYLYLYDEMHNTDYYSNTNIGKVFHYTSDKLNVVGIPLKPKKEVEKLLNCEREGIEYKVCELIPTAELQQLYDVESMIAEHEKQIKEFQKQEEEIKSAIIKAMNDNGLTSFEGEKLKITIVADSKSITFDTKKFKSDNPDMYNKYTKESTKKGYVKITLK